MSYVNEWMDESFKGRLALFARRVLTVPSSCLLWDCGLVQEQCWPPWTSSFSNLKIRLESGLQRPKLNKEILKKL